MIEKTKIGEYVEIDAAMKPLYDDIVAVMKKHGAFYYLHGDYEDTSPTLHIPNPDPALRSFELDLHSALVCANDDAGTNEIADNWLEERRARQKVENEKARQRAKDALTRRSVGGDW